MGFVLLIVSFLDLLGEIKKKRFLRNLEDTGNLPVVVPDNQSHLFDSHQNNVNERYFGYDLDRIQEFESWSAEEKREILQYLQKRQLAEMDRNRLSGIWWLFISLFRHAYTSAEHRNHSKADDKMADTRAHS